MAVLFWAILLLILAGLLLFGLPVLILSYAYWWIGIPLLLTILAGKKGLLAGLVTVAVLACVSRATGKRLRVQYQSPRASADADVITAEYEVISESTQSAGQGPPD